MPGTQREPVRGNCVYLLYYIHKRFRESNSLHVSQQTLVKHILIDSHLRAIYLDTERIFIYINSIFLNYDMLWYLFEFISLEKTA